MVAFAKSDIRDIFTNAQKAQTEQEDRERQARLSREAYQRRVDDWVNNGIPRHPLSILARAFQKAGLGNMVRVDPDHKYVGLHEASIFGISDISRKYYVNSYPGKLFTRILFSNPDGIHENRSLWQRGISHLFTSTNKRTWGILIPHDPDQKDDLIVPKEIVSPPFLHGTLFSAANIHYIGASCPDSNFIQTTTQAILEEMLKERYLTPEQLTRVQAAYTEEEARLGIPKGREFRSTPPSPSGMG